MVALTSMSSQIGSMDQHKILVSNDDTLPGLLFNYQNKTGKENKWVK